MAFNVLLIGEHPKQVELYSELVRDVTDCHIDVLSRSESSLDWLGRVNYQLIVIDSGSLRMLENIKRLSPVTSVIVISGKASVEQAVAAIRLGAEEYLRKPFNPEYFKLAVRRGLDRRQVFSESSGASAYLNLLSSCQLISGSLDRQKILEVIRTYFAQELQAAHSAIYGLENGQAKRIDLPSQVFTSAGDGVNEVLEIALQATNPLPELGAKGGVFRFVERGKLTPGLFVFRFRCVGAEDSYCVCLSPHLPAELEAFEARVRMLQAQIELAGKNIEQYQGVQHLIYVDDATGLYNTRYLNFILDREIAQTQSNGQSFAVLFMDADHFKNVNDQHGHQSGTRLLNELGGQLRKYVRVNDTVFRYGGDEFVAVLAPCDLPTASQVAERIRSSIEHTDFPVGDTGAVLKVTVSIGVAIFPDHAGSKQTIIDAADQAMYGAKRTRRNHVVIAAPGMGVAAKKAGDGSG